VNLEDRLRGVLETSVVLSHFEAQADWKIVKTGCEISRLDRLASEKEEVPMLGLNFFRWFENLKTQAKLLTVFGLVGVIIAAMAGVGIVTNGRCPRKRRRCTLDYTVR
jgi:hypothetical protein